MFLTEGDRPDLRGAVVAVTGASAGVGRAAAIRFGRCGAAMALMARDPAALEEARSEVERTGARAIAIPLDVADADAVFAAAERIGSKLGPIDIWVNNAMATVFSMVADLDPAELRRVTEVTYLGTAYGTMAALKQMRRRDRGVIVQVGSSLAYRGIPLQGAYCGAKHAVRGFTDSLRAELLHEGSGIALTAVHLPAINTPQFDWARTKRARLPRPVAPVYEPEVAARAIVRAAVAPQRKYWLGGRTLLLIMANMLVPGLLDRVIAAQAVEGQARAEPVPPGRRDNLTAPVPGLHRTSGVFSREAREKAVAIPAPFGRFGAVLAGGLVVAGIAGLAAGRGIRARREKRRG